MRGSTCGAIYVDGWSYDPRVLVQRGEAESVDEVLAEGGFVREAGVSDVDSPRDAATIAELKKRLSNICDGMMKKSSRKITYAMA